MNATDRTSLTWPISIGLLLTTIIVAGITHQHGSRLTDRVSDQISLHSNSSVGDATIQPRNTDNPPRKGFSAPLTAKPVGLLDKYQKLRAQMVRQQLRGRDIRDQRVLDAMRKVERHRYVPDSQRDSAYEDRPLSIGHQQTISQPYIVALMTQLVAPADDARVLDVGTGSGYQAAVLAELVQTVYSIEIICDLADGARKRLADQGYSNAEVRCGDGYAGWPEHAPFDAIVVAAAPDHVPQPLVDQLAPGGRLVIPVGTYFQELLLIEKQSDGSLRRTNVAPVRFVPMTREFGDQAGERD